jgi:hypothetical protein
MALSGDLKTLIPSWLTEAEIKRLADDLDREEWNVRFDARKPDNWKRISKSKLPDGMIERIFDCRPFGGELRLYVFTVGESDGEDGQIVRYAFQAE